jgi:hypothetical protein
MTDIKNLQAISRAKSKTRCCGEAILKISFPFDVRGGFEPFPVYFGQGALVDDFFRVRMAPDESTEAQLAATTRFDKL